MTPNPLILRRVLETLPRFRYQMTDEAQLHAGIARVLADAGLPFEHEHVAGPQDRFDFLVDPGIVIEVKVKGSLPEALRQVGRYIGRDDVAAVVLATTRPWGKSTGYRARNGKPLHLLHLQGAAL